MSRILAIDPGPFESGWCVIDSVDCKPLGFGKTPNLELLRRTNWGHADVVAIEMVASYGMAVGAEVFETCVWIGRFWQAASDAYTYPPVNRVKRREIKLHHCGSAAAKDSNVRQALVDRFASGQPNHGKGTKSEPGWFYGVRADIWQAYALAVYIADTQEEAAA